MRELVWLDSAVTDVVRLKDFIAKENPAAAKRAAEAIKEAAQQLMENAFIGKPVTNLFDYRDLFIRFGAAGYILRYRVHAENIYVVHIRHYRELNFKKIESSKSHTLSDALVEEWSSANDDEAYKDL